MKPTEKQRFDSIIQNNGDMCATFVRDAGLLKIRDIDRILEFAGNDPYEITTLIPYIRAKYSLYPEEYKIPKNFVDCNRQIMRYYYDLDLTLYGLGRFDFYIGNDCYSIDNKIFKTDKDHEIIFDFLVLNTQTGELSDPVNVWKKFASYEYTMLRNVFYGKKIQIQHKDDKRLISVDDKHVATVQNSQTTELTLRGIKDIEAMGCLFWNMKELHLPDTKYLGRVFAESSENSLKTVDIPNVDYVMHSCLLRNRALTELNAPLLKEKQPVQYNRLHKIVEKNMAQKTRNA